MVYLIIQREKIKKIEEKELSNDGHPNLPMWFRLHFVVLRLSSAWHAQPPLSFLLFRLH